MSNSVDSSLQPQTERKSIKTSDVDLKDTRFQVRQKMDAQKVKEYEGVIKYGGGLAAFSSRPKVWLDTKGKYLVCDGWHRIQAASNAAVTDFEADVIQGAEGLAMIAAAGANLNHGQPLTSEERTTACLRAFEAIEKLQGVPPSNQVVAELLGVSEGSVRNHRKKLEGACKLKPATHVMGKDKKVQPVKKAPVGKPVTGSTANSQPADSPSPGKSVSPKNGLSADNVKVTGTAASVPTLKRAESVEQIPPLDEKEAEETDRFKILGQAIDILRELDEDAWELCDDAEDLAQQVSELMKAAVDALVASGTDLALEAA